MHMREWETMSFTIWLESSFSSPLMFKPCSFWKFPLIPKEAEASSPQCCSPLFWKYPHGYWSSRVLSFALSLPPSHTAGLAPVPWGLLLSSFCEVFHSYPFPCNHRTSASISLEPVLTENCLHWGAPWHYPASNCFSQQSSLTHDGQTTFWGTSEGPWPWLIL